MGWPQITYLILASVGIGIALARHGQSQGNYNIWTTSLASVVTITLLILGGFFTTLHWPQITYLILAAAGFGAVMSRHGEPEGDYDAVTTIISTGLILGLLYLGGFFTGGV